MFSLPNEQIKKERGRKRGIIIKHAITEILVSVLIISSVSLVLSSGIGIQPNAAQPLGSPASSQYIRLSYTSTETRWTIVAANQRYDPNYIVAVFTDNLTGQFDWYFTKSTDRGVTWTTPEIAVNPDFDVMESELYSAAIAMDDYGTVHMSFARQKTWWPRDTAPTGIYYARYDGTDWSAPVIIYENLSPGFLWVGWNDITIGRNNMIHLVYGSDLPDNDNGDIWYCRSEDGGFTWTSPVNVNAFNGMDVGYPPSLAADDSGYLYWTNGDDWYSEEWWSEVYFRGSSNDGVTWDTQTDISRNPDADRAPRLMCDNTGGVYAIWIHYPLDNYSDTSLLFKYSTDHGSNWTPYYGGIALTSLPLGIWDCYFAELDDQGFIHIVYASAATGTQEAYYMKIDTSGNVVNPPQIITPDDGYPSIPTGVVLNGDQVCVVTKEAKDGNSEAYFIGLPVSLPIHDLAVTDVVLSKTIVGQGFGTDINVTVFDQGDYSETFNVTVYADATEIETRELMLSSGGSTTITFTWNTSGIAKGDYTISASAGPVPGEIDTEDNTFTGGKVAVAMIGDVAGGPGVFPNTSPDGRVDIIDLAIIAKCFGANYPNPRYTPNYDIDDDGRIDINDLAMAAKNYGEIDP